MYIQLNPRSLSALPLHIPPQVKSSPYFVFFLLLFPKCHVSFYLFFHSLIYPFFLKKENAQKQLQNSSEQQREVYQSWLRHWRLRLVPPALDFSFDIQGRFGYQFSRFGGKKNELLNDKKICIFQQLLLPSALCLVCLHHVFPTNILSCDSRAFTIPSFFKKLQLKLL